MRGTIYVLPCWLDPRFWAMYYVFLFVLNNFNIHSKTMQTLKHLPFRHMRLHNCHLIRLYDTRVTSSILGDALPFFLFLAQWSLSYFVNILYSNVFITHNSFRKSNLTFKLFSKIVSSLWISIFFLAIFRSQINWFSTNSPFVFLS